MPTIEVSEETYRKLEQRAVESNIGIPEVVKAAASARSSHQFPPVPSVEEFMKGMEQIAAWAKARAHLYPPGFRMDDSRESMYEGCGE